MPGGSRVYKLVTRGMKIWIEERVTRKGERSVVLVTSSERVVEKVYEELSRLGLRVTRPYRDKYGYWRVRVRVKARPPSDTVLRV